MLQHLSIMTDVHMVVLVSIMLLFTGSSSVLTLPSWL